MSIFELFLIAVGLSMDAFAVSVGKGLSLGKIKFKHVCLAGVWFGGFQALMPLIGYFLGSFFTNIITKYDHWIAFILLTFLGVRMILDARGEDEETDAKMDAKTMFLLAVATSIDALAVGVTFAFLDVSIIPAVCFIGVVTFVCSGIGIWIGSLFGARYRSKAEVAGGVILILLGVKFVVESFL